MKRSDFRYLEPLRVRWAEVDAQHIVFNAHYLMYFDTAVAGYWRSMALPYGLAMQQLDGDMFVRKATVEYHASARYDDRLHIGMRCERIGNSSLLFRGSVFLDDELLVGGELVYVFANPATKRSQPVPPVLRDWVQAFEAGQPVVNVRVGGWAELGGDARAIRQEVFEAESPARAQEGMVQDADDAGALHAVLYNPLGQALATGRLCGTATGVARLDHVAVRQPVRGAGLGTQVLGALLSAARERGHAAASVRAPARLGAFFARSGLVAAHEGEGAAHGEMVLSL